MDQLLKNIHVFPSEASYDKNIGSVADSDLALVPIKIDFWDTVPIGLPMMWFSNTLPSDRCIFIDGQSLNKNEYPELFALWGYEFGGGGDNFNAPTVRDRHLMVANSFGVVAPSLPKITGAYIGEHGGSHDQYHSGAFYTTGHTLYGDDVGSSSLHIGQDFFDASRSSNIYNGSTVQPSAVKVRLICKAK